MESSSVDKSFTVRAIGPREPNTSGQQPYTPPRRTRPAEGRMPAMQFHVDGLRMDAKPSCPTATVEKLAATDAAEPPDEPPTVRSVSYGLRVEPNNEPWVSPPPSSPRVDLPKITAPALRNFSATKESRSGK